MPGHFYGLSQPPRLKSEPGVFRRFLYEVINRQISNTYIIWTILEKTKKKLQEATNTIDKAGVRSRAIERQLRKVQELPSSETIAKIEQEISDDSVDIQQESRQDLFEAIDDE